MLKATKKLSDVDLTLPSDHTITLVYETRQKGRFKTHSDKDPNIEIGVFLERGQCLQHNDRLETECGQFIQVIAQKEQLLKATTEDWLMFSKACYHLGNRHTPIEIGPLWLTLQPDHVLKEMLESLGLSTAEVEAPFSPESGAYAKHSNSHHHHH